MRRITRGGQVSLPARARKRWSVRRVLFEDHGDHLIVRPVADDPVAAALGAFEGEIGSTIELRQIVREEELTAEERHEQ